MNLLFASNNVGKQREARAILESDRLKLKFPSDFPELANQEPAETGDTFAHNAQLKAKWYATRTGLLAVADDTGLEVAALGGAPGVHSKRFFPGPDSGRNQFLLDQLTGESNRAAQVTTALAVWDPATATGTVVDGVVTGTITQELKGQTGFGFDPIFIPSGYTLTQAEMGQEQKNKISSRRLALQQLKTYLETNYDLK